MTFLYIGVKPSILASLYIGVKPSILAELDLPECLYQFAVFCELNRTLQITGSASCRR